MKKRLPQDGSRREHRFDRAIIEHTAIEILTFIAEDEARLGRFFDLTGLSIQTLRKAAGTPSFNASLFDYLGSDEALLIAFSDRKGCDPGEVDAMCKSLNTPARDG